MARLYLAESLHHRLRSLHLKRPIGELEHVWHRATFSLDLVLDKAGWQLLKERRKILIYCDIVAFVSLLVGALLLQQWLGI